MQPQLVSGERTSDDGVERSAPASAAPGAIEGDGGGLAPTGPAVRRLGFSAAELDDLVALPDDVEAMNAAIKGADRPFNGAFVPVVLHDPTAAERSYDAAEWAADLIGSVGGRYLVVAACTDQPQTEPGADQPPLNARQWNHAAAMMERLEGVGRRFGLQVLARDTLGDLDVRDDEAVDPDRPIHYLLDTGRYLADEHVPVRLVCPEREELEVGAGRLWGRRG